MNIYVLWRWKMNFIRSENLCNLIWQWLFINCRICNAVFAEEQENWVVFTVLLCKHKFFLKIWQYCDFVFWHDIVIVSYVLHVWLLLTLVDHLPPRSVRLCTGLYISIENLYYSQAQSKWDYFSQFSGKYFFIILVTKSHDK